MALALERGDRPLPAGTEGLPRAFLQSLRTLFDILDDRRRGYVHLREIESRWRGAEARELPAGVMEGLRRAAPASGYLTFERFVLGLRATLPGADPPAESGGRRSGEKPPSPCCAEERRRKSNGQREPGRGQPRGRGGDAKATGQSQGDSGHSGTGDARRHPRGRAEHRRHTITNGVDFSMGWLDEMFRMRLSAFICLQPRVQHCPLPSYPGQHQPSAAPCLPPAPEAATAPELPILREMLSVPGDVPLLCGMPPLPPVSKLASKPGGTGARQLVASCSPSWVRVVATYSTFFMPLSNSLHSTKALRFFLWVTNQEIEKIFWCTVRHLNVQIK